MDHEFLISFDTDRIKEYVFTTDRLREVRGASLILKDLDDLDMLDSELKKNQLSGKVHFFAGGSGVITTGDENEARRIVTCIERLFQEKTRTASISAAIQTYQTDFSDFQEKMRLAALQLRQVKDEKAARWMPGLEPYMQACQSCGIFPASFRSAVDEQLICETCQTKRARFTKYREEDDPRTPEELNAIGEVARPKGYIGFIYADGNHMGDRLGDFTSLPQYAEFSRRLKALIDTTVRAALPASLVRSGIHPYEDLLLGGDDLILVTAGDLAIPAAMKLSREFSENARKLLDDLHLPAEPPLTLAIGVVLAHAAFPIPVFNNLANELLQRAKQACSLSGYRQNAIDFMVVTSAGSSGVSGVRKEILTEQSFVFPHGDRKVYLTQRPYLATELEKLVEDLKELKKVNFPRSQLQYLYEGLFHSQVEAIFRWGRVTGHIKKDQRQALLNFYHDFGDNQAAMPPWKRADETSPVDYTSAFGDLVEIYPFIPD